MQRWIASGKLNAVVLVFTLGCGLNAELLPDQSDITPIPEVEATIEPTADIPSAPQFTLVASDVPEIVFDWTTDRWETKVP